MLYALGSRKRAKDVPPCQVEQTQVAWYITQLEGWSVWRDELLGKQL